MLARTLLKTLASFKIHCLTATLLIVISSSASPGQNIRTVDPDPGTPGLPGQFSVSGKNLGDCNANGIPDETEFDCDANGVPDDCDLADDPSLDANLNGLIDACECPVQVKLHPSFVSDNAQFGSVVDIDGDLAIVGAPRETNAVGSEAGAAYIFRRQGLEWVEEARLLDPNGTQGDRFGQEVAISGDLAAVTAPKRSTHNTGEDSVFVYRYEPTSRQWNLETVIHPGMESITGNLYGAYLDIEQDTIAILNPTFDGGNTNIPFTEALFYRNDPELGWHTTGSAQTSLKPEHFVWFPPGSYVLNNDRFIAGSPGQSFGPGSVFIHRYDGTQWIQEAHLFSDSGDPTDIFGFSVDLDGDLAIVGAGQDDEAGPSFGAAFIYRFDGAEWIVEQKFFPPPGFEAFNFGTGVAIEGDTAVITGKKIGTTRTHMLFIYRFDPLARQWVFQRRIVALDGGSQIGFEFKIDAGGGQVIVPSRTDSEHAPNAGAVYIITGLFGPDCDNNLEPDACDIYFGRAQDLNANTIPDHCDLNGDINQDGVVNITDLLAILSAWGRCPDELACPADLDGNSMVNVRDLLSLLHGGDFHPGRSGDHRK